MMSLPPPRNGPALAFPIASLLIDQVVAQLDRAAHLHPARVAELRRRKGAIERLARVPDFRHRPARVEQLQLFEVCP